VRKQPVSETFFNTAGSPDQASSPAVPETPDQNAGRENLETEKKKCFGIWSQKGDGVNGLLDYPGYQQLQEVDNDQTQKTDCDEPSSFVKV
jgi:hypothetical protein